MAHTHTAEARTGLFGGLFSNYADAKVEFFRRRIFSNTVRNLERLSDHQLADIGIDRSEIKQRAYESVFNGAPLRH
ncbi:DUF1127 domain-containing protein [Ruegeria profundi]|uniref:DUF1127 domain-containing protein n=1 Tax=Ruegeria profundi TaxID=1685378 RepID=UPI00147C663D